MRSLIPALAVFATGCATTPAGLAETRVEETVTSSKSPSAFATCVAENLAGEAQLRSNGDHHWVLRIVGGVPRHRWDFRPTATGSKAELHSTGLIGDGADKVRACA